MSPQLHVAHSVLTIALAFRPAKENGIIDIVSIHICRQPSVKKENSLVFLGYACTRIVVSHLVLQCNGHTITGILAYEAEANPSCMPVAVLQTDLNAKHGPIMAITNVTAQYVTNAECLNECSMNEGNTNIRYRIEKTNTLAQI